MFLLGIILLILGLILSVALHELGHLLPAKRFGALVPEYWIGFGPTLFSRRIGGTVYGLKAILLGGYVRIVGMFPPSTVKTSSRKADRGLVAEARLQSAEDIAAARQEGMEGTPFYRLSTGQKLIVMMGGPLMNLFLAFLFTAIVVMGIGWTLPSTTIEEVVPTTGELQEGLGAEPSPAAQAGMRVGDQVLSWGGTEVVGWEQLRQLMADTPADGTEVTVERNGSVEELYVAPLETAEGKKIGIVSQLQRTRGSFAESADITGQMFTGTAAAILNLPASLWNLVKNIGTEEPRDPEGAVSVVGVARIAGEVATVEGAGVTLVDRAAMLLSLLASLNMALFVFNLLPLPPLDGGHVAGALWGGARNLRARMAGNAPPPPVDTAKMVPLSYAVFALLIGISIILIFADIIKPLQW